MAFRGCKDLPKAFEAIEIYVEYFKYLFYQNILMKSVRIRLYSASKTPENPEINLQQFMGICMLMSVLQLPSVRYY